MHDDQDSDLPHFSPQQLLAHSRWVSRYCGLLNKRFAPVFFFFNLISNLKGIGSIAVYGYMIDSIATFSKMGFSSVSAWKAFGLYAGYNIAELLLNMFEQGFVENKKAFLVSQLKRAYLHKLSRLDVETLDKKVTTQVIAEKYTTIGTMFGHYYSSIGFLSDLTAGTILLLIIAYFAWPLALVLLILAIPRFSFDRSMRRANTNAQNRGKAISSKLKLLVTQWTDKMFLTSGMAALSLSVLDKKYIEYLQRYEKLAGPAKRKWNLVNRILDLGNSLTVIVGYAWILFKNASLGAVGSIYVQLRLVNLLDSKIKKVVTTYNALEESCAKIVEIEQVFDWPEKTSEQETEDNPAIKLGNIEFVRSGASSPTLADLNMSFDYNTKTDVIIPDLFTRDTFIRIIGGLTEPGQGDVKIGNRKIHPGDADVMAIYGDASYLRYLNIKENISLKPDWDDKKMTEVLKMVGIPDETASGDLPASNNGDLITRILAARVFYLQPKWLIWQSARLTSPKVETEIFNLFYQFLPSVITVTERISSSLQAPRVVLIRQGKIVDDGPPKELIEKGGEYAVWLDRFRNPPVKRDPTAPVINQPSQTSL